MRGQPAAKRVPRLIHARRRRPEKPVRYGAAFAVFRAGRRRPDAQTARSAGLLGGMAEIPTGDWAEDAALMDRPGGGAGRRHRWRRLPAPVVAHTFTHFHLQLAVHRATAEARYRRPPGRWWSAPEDQDGEALPTVMRKVLKGGAGRLSDSARRGRGREAGATRSRRDAITARPRSPACRAAWRRRASWCRRGSPNTSARWSRTPSTTTSWPRAFRSH